MTLKELVYQYLTHGYDKNGIVGVDAETRATNVLNCMSNAEFLDLISMLLEDMK